MGTARGARRVRDAEGCTRFQSISNNQVLKKHHVLLSAPDSLRWTGKKWIVDLANRRTGKPATRKEANICRNRPRVAGFGFRGSKAPPAALDGRETLRVREEGLGGLGIGD